MSFVLVRIDTLEALTVGADAVFVGSADWKVDLCLAGDGVDDVHCEMTVDPHGIRVDSLSPEGVQVNGQTIQSALLFANDQLTIGPFEFRVERAGSDSSRPIRQLPATLHAGVSIRADDAEEDAQLTSSPMAMLPVPGSQPVAAEEDRNGLWLARLGLLELGPMSWAEVDAMLDRGELNASDSVCRAGSNDWQPIQSLAGSRQTAFVPSATILSDSSKPSEFDSGRREDSRQTKSLAPETPDARSRVADQASFDSRPDHPNDRPAPPLPAVAEPQYFIQSPSGEEGPLPRHTVQDLVNRGELPADTPVRLEWNTRWSSAIDLGFAYPNGKLQPCEERGGPAETKPVSPEHSRISTGGSVRWTLMAPIFYTRSLVYSLRSLPLKHLVLLLLICGAVGLAAQRWMNRRARTALTGTVLLDDKPLGDVVVTLTGTTSGEIAAGITDNKGQFRVFTISGKLTPGPYRITVQPKAGRGAAVPHGDGKQVVPERYTLLATSDATIDVSAEQASYSVALTRFSGPAGVQYGRSGTRAQ